MPQNIGQMIILGATWLIGVVQTLLLIRALLSWFPMSGTGILSTLYRVLYQITEPLIAPFRRLLYHTKIIQQMPIDISFLLAVVALEIIRRLFYMLLL